MTEYQFIINIVAGLVFSVMGWFAREMWSAVKELQSSLSKLREEIAKDYTPKDDFKSFATEIREMFREISNKLDHKADK